MRTNPTSYVQPGGGEGAAKYCQHSIVERETQFETKFQVGAQLETLPLTELETRNGPETLNKTVNHLFQLHMAIYFMCRGFKVHMTGVFHVVFEVLFHVPRSKIVSWGKGPEVRKERWITRFEMYRKHRQTQETVRAMANDKNAQLSSEYTFNLYKATKLSNSNVFSY